MSKDISKSIIIALDNLEVSKALEIAKALSGSVWGFKVNDLIVSEGVSIVEKLADYGNVFADSKLHDIPNTVANGVKRLSKAGANLITVHSSGGASMLKAAKEHANESKILGVSILTSLNEQECKHVYSHSPKDMVSKLCELAADSGIDGIVCSPLEVSSLNQNDKTKNLLKVTPGIRGKRDEKDDQSRTLSAKEALNSGSDLLVIGRPITKAIDYLDALRTIALS